MPAIVVLILIVAAAVLALVDIIDSRGRSFAGWGLLALAVAVWFLK